MKSFYDYYKSLDGAIHALGKDFELYGMMIGRCEQLIDGRVIFVRAANDIMEVPILIDMQKVMPGILTGIGENPLLREIKEVVPFVEE